ncbi:L10-interacting MYB domain-containing protein-like [Brachypodium distachyon]|uniref:L10-interacting MYB domain-containing protein-like n=1 Tax=Brachypodium distachyon TaxID=15368 RepID=UPI00052FF8B4|nr:L10-interacting MYB domain-containing protein-like [Brachypodium distachyon]|eukprot:XP_010233300.1 L10-interacting MYB domain-containing protein-like [Brachypodium distachyon]
MEAVKVEPVKAVWDGTAEQVQLGNRTTKFLSATGYKNLVADFNAQTGRNYERKQLKNRWDDLKAIYSAWVFYNIKATGLGWNEETQTIIADDEQWVELIKPIKAFRKGPSDNLELMHIMLDKANVDGTTSVMPGVEEVAAIQVEEDVVDVDEEETETPTQD